MGSKLDANSVRGGHRVAGGPYPIEAIVAEIIARSEAKRESVRAIMEEYFERNPHLADAKGLARAYAAGVLRSFRLLDLSLIHISEPTRPY